MKKNVVRIIAMSAVIVMGVPDAGSFQAARFGVDLYLAVGPVTRDTLTLGVSGDGPGSTINDNTYALDPEGPVFGPLGHYGESPAPPADPDGNRRRWVDLPGRTVLGAGLFRYDFRGFTSPSQIDSFAARIDGLTVETFGLTLSWPSNLSSFGSAWSLHSRTGTTISPPVADMLATTSYTFPVTGSRVEFVVIKTGVVTGVTLIDNGVPTAFALEQNFPNPFNPSTEIRFHLPQSGHVSLIVYNMLGQEVATLVNGVKTAGSYGVSFDAGNLASGMYLYRLQAAGFADMKKLVILK